MATYQVFKNAPITEALIDVRVKVMDDFDVERFKSLHNEISARYPDVKSRKKWEWSAEFGKEESIVSSSDPAIDGYIFTSLDKKRIFQARKDGFTFNQLKPYDTWEALRNEAEELWKLYRALYPSEIIRVALRYINNIDIPLPMQDFSEYLTAAPAVPEGLPQSVSSFIARLLIDDSKSGLHAIITQAFEQIVDPHFLPIILDVDVFKQKEGMSDDEAWQTLEALRDFKNRIFFSSLTDKAKELFQ